MFNPLFKPKVKVKNILIGVHTEELSFDKLCITLHNWLEQDKYEYNNALSENVQPSLQTQG